MKGKYPIHKEEKMKKYSVALILVLLLAGGLVFAEDTGEEAKDPHFAASFLVSSIFPFTAPVGGTFEAFFGHLGVGASLSGIFLMVEDVAFFTVEPGAFVRLYFGDLASCFFVSAGAMYWTLGGASAGKVEVFDDNVAVAKLNAGIGYNALMGKKKDVKFSVELGPRYLMGKTEEGWEQSGIIMMHFMLSFGKAF